MPIVSRLNAVSESSLWPLRCVPATEIFPPLTRSSPEMTMRSVVFPEPEGPTMPIASPALTLRFAPRRISTAPARLGKVRRTFSSEISGIDMGRVDGADQRYLSSTAPCGSRICFLIGQDDPPHVACSGVVLLLRCQLLPQETITVLAFGDSLTAGLGVDPQSAFPVKLEAALKSRGHNVRVINAGVSGDTAAAGRDRLDWVLTEDIDAVIVELGANDALRGMPPAETRSALAAILETMKQRKLPVLLAGMLAPRNLGPDFAAGFDPIFPELAKQFGVHLLPVFPRWSGDAARPQPGGRAPPQSFGRRPRSSPESPRR